MHVTELNLYPLKGLRPLQLQSAELEVGCGFESDREWALLLGSAEGEWQEDAPEKLFRDPSGKSAPIPASPAAPFWHGSKYKFHQLINSPELAQIQLLSYGQDARIVLSGPSGDLDAKLSTIAGKQAAEQYFSKFLKSHGRLKEFEGKGPNSTGLTLCHAQPGSRHHFENVGGLSGEELLHIVCLPSVRELDKRRTLHAKEGESLDPTPPRQFRANIYLDGPELKPFEEFSWCGRRLRFEDGLELEVLEPTIRCPASSAHPELGTRVRSVATELKNLFPEQAAFVGGTRVALGGKQSKGGFMGIYARVVKRGTLHVGAEPHIVGHVALRRRWQPFLGLALVMASLIPLWKYLENIMEYWECSAA
eukprot:TRINITY_DN82027_c0_g1_i1.p1 TRINITY_DN82027_c0_g1~~TRINITY_DN82027_c0_g1_i1.p1  ORF type:complete len:364 (-),score=70.96 TRINITY_DN82027_c0_g1_i1:290-1381(-)